MVETTTFQMKWHKGDYTTAIGRFPGTFTEDLSGVNAIIEKHAVRGGRLICMEVNGNTITIDQFQEINKDEVNSDRK